MISTETREGIVVEHKNANVIAQKDKNVQF